MEQNYPAESNTVPACCSNQFAHQNQWFRFNLFFSPSFIHSALLDSQDCISPPQWQPLKIKSEKCYIAAHSLFYQGPEGIRVMVFGLELCLLQHCFLNVLCQDNSVCGLIARLCKVLYCCSSCSIIVACCVPIYPPHPTLSPHL